MQPDVKGFIAKPRLMANDAPYGGRLSLPDVQWTGRAQEIFGTATCTLQQIADAAEGRLLWTDQAVQRGILPTAPPNTPRELSLSEGYPDTDLYIFDADNADDMCEKLLQAERLFFDPLVWNLRPGTFEAYCSDANELSLYDGRVYLPDSHHRHQAILKAVRAYRDNPAGHKKFDLSRQFKVEIYFLDPRDEGNYFFDKNQRPKPTALSKAYDLTTEDDLSTLAKAVLARLPDLNEGTNRTTDRLNKKAPHFVTLSTLRDMMRTFTAGSEVDATELDGLAFIAAEFFEMLAAVRPELRVATPHSAREGTLASQAVMMHGYATLMRDYSLDVPKVGPTRARSLWRKRLDKLAPATPYKYGGWKGDFLSKQNPLWAEHGLIREDPESGKVTISSTGGTRSRAGRELERYLEVGPDASVGS